MNLAKLKYDFCINLFEYIFFDSLAFGWRALGLRIYFTLFYFLIVSCVYVDTHSSCSIELYEGFYSLNNLDYSIEVFPQSFLFYNFSTNFSKYIFRDKVHPSRNIFRRWKVWAMGNDDVLLPETRTKTNLTVDRWIERDGKRESETNRGRRIHGSMDPKRDGARLSVYPTWKPETGVPLRRERRQAYRNTGTGRVRNLGDRRRAGQYRLALITRWWNVPARWLRPGSPLGTPLRFSQRWKNHARSAWLRRLTQK